MACRGIHQLALISRRGVAAHIGAWRQRGGGAAPRSGILIRHRALVAASGIRNHIVMAAA